VNQSECGLLALLLTTGIQLNSSALLNGGTSAPLAAIQCYRQAQHQFKMKVILIDTPKGQFHLPLQKVAEHRADYYACEVDGHEKNSPEWQEEVDWVMKDNFEGIDWLINNTNWDEWESSATKVNDKVNVTDDDFWCSSDGFEIVEA